MKGIARGVLGLALAVTAAACTDDKATGVGGDFDQVQVDRISMQVSIGDSVAVLARLVNDLNTSTPTTFTVTDKGSGIQVNYDPLYRPDYLQGDSLIAPLVKSQQRYFVLGTAIGNYQFTLNSGGASTTINVYVTPDDVGSLSLTSAVAGQFVTITAPALLKFSPNSVVTFPTGVIPFIVSRAADSSSITFLVNPGTTGRATVTNVIKTYAPAAPKISVPSSNEITVPALTVGMSTTNTTTGGTVVLTAPGALRFSPTSVVTCPGGALAVQNRAADGSTITIQVGPNIDGTCTVTLLTYPATPAAPAISLPTTAELLTPAVLSVATAVSTTTPSVGQSFTVALGNGLRFTSTSKILIGSVEAGIISISADSITATVVTPLNASGPMAFTDIIPASAPALKLALPSDKTIAPTATFGGVTLTGTDAFATAPTITLPTVVGQSAVVTDNGNVWGTPAGCVGGTGADNCKVYKIVVPAGQTFTLVGKFNTSADLGFYRFNSTFGGQATIADALGQSATNTESGTLGANLAAGTYYIMVAYYGPDSYGGGAVARPTILQLKITRTI